MIFDERRCELGEGALWHPIRKQLFWFDILGQSLLSQDRDGPKTWRFPELVSAAGWVSREALLIAGERDLFLFDLDSEEIEPLVELEPGIPTNRSNDGRADRQGGFWIGTMSKKAEDGKGAIYRFYKGELRRLFAGISIPNSICFTLDGRTAQFSDTKAHKVYRVALDSAGWPVGEPVVWMDHSATGILPDGSIFDADGLMWQAQWGSGHVAVYQMDGTLVNTVPVCGPHSSCPAFGGDGLTTLFCTTAMEHMSPADRTAMPDAGKVFSLPNAGKGLPEPQVLLA